MLRFVAWVLFSVGFLLMLIGASAIWRVLSYRARHRQEDGSLDEPPWMEDAAVHGVAFALGGVVVWAFAWMI